MLIFIEKIWYGGDCERVEYDPNRSCYIMLVKFEDGSHAYYLAPQKIKIGDKIENGSKKKLKLAIVCVTGYSSGNKYP